MLAWSARRAIRLACCSCLLLAFMLPCAAQTPLPPATKSHQQNFAVAFIPVPGQGAPLITVWINGQVEATFVVDTGTNNCLISKSLVKKLRLTPFPALLSDGKPLLFEGKQPPAVILTSLKIGGKTGLLNIQPLVLPFLVLADDQLRVSADRLVDGMIGSNLLDSFAVALNFPGHAMALCYPGNLSQSEARALGYEAADGTVIPLLLTAKDSYSVQVGLDNNGISCQEDLLLDTGSQTTAIPRRAALDLSLASLGQIPQANHSGGYFTVRVARPQALVLGDILIKQPIVNYGIKADNTPRLGLDILSSYYVLMDFPAKKMYLQPAVPTIKIGLPQSTPAPAKR